MASRNRIPQALEPYLRLPPEASQILFTATLACSINWVTCRYISSILHGAQKAHTIEPEVNANEDVAVVLASWMRDLRFWKTELRRTVGLDTTRLINSGRLEYVDCLNNVPTRDTSGTTGTEETICEAISKVQKHGRRIVLILDNPDVLLALAACNAEQLNELVLKLRSAVHSTAIVCSADSPLVGAATQTLDSNPLPIAVETSSFLTQQAHNASLILSTRELDTGAARDVSGVLRITGGGDMFSGSEDNGAQQTSSSLESLYLVKTDGSAEVFPRGAVPAT